MAPAVLVTHRDGGKLKGCIRAAAESCFICGHLYHTVYNEFKTNTLQKKSIIDSTMFR
jgi:uncharacterized Fe-S cluster-containing MiaB family protein